MGAVGLTGYFGLHPALAGLHVRLYDRSHDALRRAVERLLEDPLAESILRAEFNKEEPVIVSVGEKGLVFTQKKSGSPEPGA